jgi:hypothetical protein
VLLRRAQTACKQQLCEQPRANRRPCWDNSKRKR